VGSLNCKGVLAVPPQPTLDLEEWIDV
jgi:hypothetical protein